MQSLRTLRLRQPFDREFSNRPKFSIACDKDRAEALSQSGSHTVGIRHPVIDLELRCLQRQSAVNLDHVNDKFIDQA